MQRDIHYSNVKDIASKFPKAILNKSYYVQASLPRGRANIDPRSTGQRYTTNF